MDNMSSSTELTTEVNSFKEFTHDPFMSKESYINAL